MVSRDRDISRMPESCIADVLSLTSPRDSCAAAAVSTTFRRAADSDNVWGRFLPSDLSPILARAVDLPAFSSKKELYFRLCDPILIDGGKMSFQLERSSGKKCFMISARELVIIWESSPQFWKWIPSSDSRFSEVAELLDVCWLEIRGKIDARVLSPKTSYCVYLVFKVAEEEYGLSIPAATSVVFGTDVSERKACLTLNEQRELEFPYYRHIRQIVAADGEQVQVPHERKDGWLEVEMGEFFVDDGSEGEVDVSLKEVKGGHWKRGLIVQGIEVRPKK